MTGCSRILDEFRPDEAAVEATFVNKDAKATLKLGQARGIAMVVPARAGLPVAEYAPNLVKKSIVGVGHGDKAQVRMMIGVLLPKADPSLRRCRRCARHRGDARASPAERDPQSGGAMIGKLKGVIESPMARIPDHPRRQRRRLSRALLGADAAGTAAASGEPATLAIETYVREDQIRLFGFMTDVEREWFRLLQTVQGVGAKVALAVLGTLKPADLASAIAMRDKAMVARTPGVGPKVAERIVTELKDKAPAYADVDPALVRLSGALDERRAPQPISDAVSALVNLGYGAAAGRRRHRRRGRAAPARAPRCKTLIRLGLKELAK